MKSVFLAVAGIAVVIGLSACDNSTDPGDAIPHLETRLLVSAPPAPAGSTAVCYTGPDGLTIANLCTVIKWHDVTYWVFAYDDSRNAVNLVAYDKDEKILSQNEREGTTQVYLITLNENLRQVTLYGVGASTAMVPWTELEVD